MSGWLNTYEEYLCEHTWAQLTEDAYRRAVCYLAEWLEQNELSLSNLSIKDVKLFIRERGWGNSMTRQLNAALVPFVRRTYGENHPLVKWRVRHEKLGPKRTLSKSEAEKLLASFQPGISSGQLKDRRFWICDTSHPLGIRNHAILWLLTDTGYRSRELCRFRLDNIDLASRSIVVQTKGGEYHTRSYTQSSEPALFAWLAIRERFVTPHSGDALFLGVLPQTRGVPLTHNGLRVMLRKLGQVTAVPRLSPHVFRRTKATLMQSVAGAPSRVVQLEMDWKNIDEAERYSGAMHKEVAKRYLPGNFLFTDTVVPSQ